MLTSPSLIPSATDKRPCTSGTPIRLLICAMPVCLSACPVCLPAFHALPMPACPATARTSPNDERGERSTQSEPPSPLGRSVCPPRASLSRTRIRAGVCPGVWACVCVCTLACVRVYVMWACACGRVCVCPVLLLVQPDRDQFIFSHRNQHRTASGGCVMV
jgi:hypothetical protein